MGLMDSALTMPGTVLRPIACCPWIRWLYQHYAADLVRSGELYGDARRGGEIAVVCADAQTAGRGRLDHRWTSRPGESFTVSFVVNVPVSIVRDASIGGWLQMIAGLAVLEAIRGACRTGAPSRSSNGRTTSLSAAGNLGAFSPKWCRFPIAANVWRSCSALA